MIIATQALPTYCSTNITVPLPINKIKNPLMDADFMASRSKSFSFFQTVHAIIINPAIRNRMAPSKKGGNPLRASRIKKYVEPQTMYTVTNARITDRDPGVLVALWFMDVV